MLKATNKLTLRDYQITTIDKMVATYKKEDKGIVVLPTGAGKTTVAAMFIHKMLATNTWHEQKTVVLWLAHSIDLLEQTMGAFSNVFEEKNMVVVSSKNSSLKQLNALANKSDKRLIFASYQSCSTKTKSATSNRKIDKSLNLLKDFLRDSNSERVFVVIDEAHRAVARTYQNIMNGLLELKDQKNNINSVQFLGLTATPIRVNENEQDHLHALFNNKLIHQVAMEGLIRDKYLSFPEPIPVQTHMHESELLVSTELQDKLKRYGTLTEELQTLIGENPLRNKVIVDTYLKDKGKYKKTIVFAANIVHATTLFIEFGKVGVKAVLVHSGVDSNMNNDAIASFKDENSGIDVIINVNMLTEGIDIPQTQTVFLTRPTNSESLFRQMIGRALRGPKSGGTEKAYLVTFVDTWETYSPLSGQFVLDGLQQEVDELDHQSPKKQKGEIPWEIIFEVYSTLPQEAFKSSEAYGAVGIYEWNSEADEFDFKQQLIVFDNFEGVVNQLIGEVKDFVYDVDELTLATLEKRFRDCPPPQPIEEYQLIKIKDLLNTIQDGGEFSYFSLAQITQYSATELVKKLVPDLEGQINQEAFEKVFNENEACRKLYADDYDEFLAQVYAEKKRLKNILSVVETGCCNSLNLKPWQNGHTGYNLVEIANDSLAANATNSKRFTLSNTEILKHLRFTLAAKLGTAWAYHTDSSFFDPKHEIVFENRLNSPDVPLFVLEGIMYHELIHNEIGNHEKHNAKFRALEQAFIPSEKAIADAENNHPKYASRIKAVAPQPIKAMNDYLKELGKEL